MQLAFFKIISEKSSYSARNVVIASGFYDLPKMLDVPGEELPKVTHYYKEAHPYAMQNVVVVGASNSAVDAALEIWRKGGHKRCPCGPRWCARGNRRNRGFPAFARLKLDQGRRHRH